MDNIPSPLANMPSPSARRAGDEHAMSVLVVSE